MSRTGLPRLRTPALALVSTLVLASLTAVAAPLEATTAAAATSTSGSVRIAIGEPESLLPSSADSGYAREVIDGLFTGLVTYDAHNDPVKTDLAAAITTSDQQVWDIRLTPGWTFSNGEAVTAASFVNAWNFAALSSNGQYNGYYFSSILGYDAVAADRPKVKALSGLRQVGDMEFTVTLRSPDSSFLSALGAAPFLPLPSVAYTDLDAYAEAPVGNGPFMLKGAWQHSTGISLVRNPAYPGSRKPLIDSIDYSIYVNGAAAYADSRSGRVDVLPYVPVANYDTTSADFPGRTTASKSSRYSFLTFPSFDPAYVSVKVRKAISMSIDRKAIAASAYAGAAVAADDFLAPTVPGYRKGGCGAACVYNPGGARKLWAGVTKHPASVTINYNTDGGHKAWVTKACASITKSLHVKCVARASRDFEGLLDGLDRAAKHKKTFGAFRSGWIMDYPSAMNYLEPLYASYGASNYYGYDNPTFDLLLSRAASSGSTSGQQRNYRRADALLARDLPVVPLFFGLDKRVWSTHVTGLRFSPFGVVDKLSLRTT